MGVLSVFLWMQDLNGVVFRILIGIFWVGWFYFWIWVSYLTTEVTINCL
ncbi:hypothetical protein [uncultured Gammaproteobacteria bacterium]|nr:hypothetical protein [uncultured Gammaproteobacteria bacterium]